MEKLPANAGIRWIKQGFALFRKQPAELSTLFLGYMLLMLALGVIPLVGQIVPLMSMPLFFVAFLQACKDIEQGKRAYPTVLLAGIRSPAFVSLLLLGVLYLLSAAAAVAASSLVDGGLFWDVMSGQAGPKSVQGGDMLLGMLFAAALYVPAAMALWYAAPLIMWQKMGIGKALFYSFFAVLRAGKAFLMFGLAWAVMGILLPVLFSSTIAIVTGKPAIAVLILLPVSIVLTVVMYCSFYLSYTDVFGRPEAPPE